MAISVDTVYKTVLSILNKEQRGYMTPDEFNRVGTQVQLEIFESYFEDINQQLRIPQSDVEYADRQENVDSKLSIFKTFGSCSYDNSGFFTVPANLHKIGTVIYKDEIEIERVGKNELLYINLSPLTKPTVQFPIYTYENSVVGTSGSLTSNPKIYVSPSTINSDIIVSYIRKPNNPFWGFTGVGGAPWTSGPYIYSQTASTQFELDASEQTNVIVRILSYAGVIIRDQEIVQAASQKIQAEEINSKN
jgi:hypothetical protein